MLHRGYPFSRPAVLSAAALIAVTLLVGGLATADESVPERRLQREIEIMETIISDVLVESPNWLVSWGGPTHGAYIEGYGVMFAIETSLVDNRGWKDRDKGFSFLRKLTGGRVVIFSDDDEEEIYIEGDEDNDEQDREDDEAYKRWRESRREREQRRYDRGKQELRDVLIDGADILEELAADEWVTIVAFLDDDHRYFRKHDLSRLLLKVRARDLQDYASGRLEREALEGRILETEY